MKLSVRVHHGHHKLKKNEYSDKGLEIQECNPNSAFNNS